MKKLSSLLIIIFALAGCVLPDNGTDDPVDPNAETRAVTLNIARTGLSLMSQSITLTEGESYTCDLNWQASFAGNLDGLIASVSGNTKAFDNTGKKTTVNITIKIPVGVNIYRDDLDKLIALLDTIGSELAAMNVTFSHNGASITPVENPNARAVTLSISRIGLSLMSQSITLTEGQTYTRDLNWLAAYTGNLDGLIASVSGNTAAFTDTEKETKVSIAINVPAGVSMYQDDLDKLITLLDTIGDELAAMNVTFNHNGADIAAIEHEQAIISLMITINGAASQPTAITNIILSDSTVTEASFTWLADYQHYTVPEHSRSYSASISGDETVFSGAHYPTLKLLIIAPNGTQVELSAADEARLTAAVQAALDAHFTNGNKPAAESLRSTGIINPKKNNGQNYENDLSADPILTVSLGGPIGKLEPGTAHIVVENYADPETIAAFTIPDSAFKTAIAGKDITLDIQGSAESTVSLAYVHYLRQALQSAVGTGKNVSIDSALTPVFDGRDWWTHYWEEKDLYGAYPKNTDTILMNGIKISKDLTDDKYLIVYDRELKVSRPVWQNNNQSIETSFHGFGLKSGASGSILPFDNGKSTVFGGDWREEVNISCYPVVPDFTAYDAALKEAGLHPSQNDTKGNPICLDHSHVRVSGVTGSNVMSNGIYDFVLAYYNPGLTGASAEDDALKALMPDWRLSGLSFDGYAKDSNGNYIKDGGKYRPALPEDVASRNIGGVVSASPDRKYTADGAGYQKDEPRSDFVGSVTYAMAKYMFDRFGIKEFSNTNIIGDSQIGDPNVVDNGGRLDITDRTWSNVAFIGDYSRFNTFSIESYGVIDVQGNLPKQIRNVGQDAKYLNIWPDVSRETNVLAFPVAAIRGSGGEFITTSNYVSVGAEARVIIYHNKYDGTPPNNSGVQPHHRAFMVGGTPKLTGGSIPSSNTAAYQGTRPSNPVPNLDENAWIEYANNGGALPANLASNYAGLQEEYRITQEEFDEL